MQQCVTARWNPPITHSQMGSEKAKTGTCSGLLRALRPVAKVALKQLDVQAEDVFLGDVRLCADHVPGLSAVHKALSEALTTAGGSYDHG